MNIEVLHMTDLVKTDIITDGHGNHFRFVGLYTQEELALACEELKEHGFVPCYNQRVDNKLYEVLTKFSPAEEVQLILEQQHCTKCPAETKQSCSEKTCAIKKKLEENLWRERMGFINGIKHDLKKLRENTTQQ